MGKTVAPYGSWASPISIDRGRGDARFEPSSTSTSTECSGSSSAAEGGRAALMQEGVGELNPGFDARSRVHEYGWRRGLAAWRQRLLSRTSLVTAYRVESGGLPLGGDAGTRRAERAPLRGRPRHAQRFDDRVRPRVARPVRLERARLSSRRRSGDPMRSRADVTSTLRPESAPMASGSRGSPGTTRCCRSSAASCGRAVSTARPPNGFGPDESVFQPEWSADGRLHWVSDRDGWWNLYRDGEQLTSPRPSSSGTRTGSSVCAPTISATAELHARVIEKGVHPLFAVLDPETGERRPRPPLHRGWCSPFASSAAGTRSLRRSSCSPPDLLLMIIDRILIRVT